MAISLNHIPFYRIIFKIAGIFSEPFLMLGYQDINQHKDMPDDFRYKDVKHLIMSKGVKEIKTLDFFDNRADLKYDLNFPIPEYEHQAYKVVFDIGTLEHVFDTRQCLENCLRMVKVNGLYFLHTVVKGYFRHGLHVFNPEGLIDVLRLNNFEILYLKYSTSEGVPIEDPTDDENVLIWMVAKKIKEIDNFKIPQQKVWEGIYNKPLYKEHGAKMSFIKLPVFIILRMIWRLLLSIKRKLKRFLI